MYNLLLLLFFVAMTIILLLFLLLLLYLFFFIFLYNFFIHFFIIFFLSNISVSTSHFNKLQRRLLYFCLVGCACLGVFAFRCGICSLITGTDQELDFLYLSFNSDVLFPETLLSVFNVFAARLPETRSYILKGFFSMLDDICYLEGKFFLCNLSLDLRPNQLDCIQVCMIWRESDAIVTMALQNAVDNKLWMGLV